MSRKSTLAGAPDAQRDLVPAPTWARLNGITQRTQYNWEKAGIVPTPVRINGRKYYRRDTQPKFDQVAS
jgi:predicted site-specific integrase-resolvase